MASASAFYIGMAMNVSRLHRATYSAWGIAPNRLAVAGVVGKALPGRPGMADAPLPADRPWLARIPESRVEESIPPGSLDSTSSAPRSGGDRVLGPAGEEERLPDGYTHGDARPLPGQGVRGPGRDHEPRPARRDAQDLRDRPRRSRPDLPGSPGERCRHRATASGVGRGSTREDPTPSTAAAVTSTATRTCPRPRWARPESSMARTGRSPGTRSGRRSATWPWPGDRRTGARSWSRCPRRRWRPIRSVIGKSSRRSSGLSG